MVMVNYDASASRRRAILNDIILHSVNKRCAYHNAHQGGRLQDAGGQGVVGSTAWTKNASFYFSVRSGCQMYPHTRSPKKIIMAQTIPLALDKNRGKVLPGEEIKDEGPFTCIECAMPVVLAQGNSSFAHASGEDHDCPAGESLKTLAARMIIAKYITKIQLSTMCSKREHKLEKQYARCTASLDLRYVGHYPGDVAVMEGGELKAIVGVKCFRNNAYSHYSTRIDRVGHENVWEVDADAIIAAQSRIHATEGSFHLDAANHSRCRACTVAITNSPQWKKLKRAISRGDWDPPSPTRAERKKQREARLYPYGKPLDGLCSKCRREL